MARRRLGVIVVGLIAAIGIVAMIAWALLQTPDFYQQELKRSVPATVRKNEAKVFVQRTLQLAQEVKHSDEWSQEFEQDQVNSWIAEDLQRQFADVIPSGVTEPRVQFSDGWIDIAFRYRKDEVSGVVSARVRAWAPEPNKLAIEIRSIRAGLVPLPLDQVLDEISKRTDMGRLRVERKLSGGADVLLVHLDGRLPERAVLEGVAIVPGKLRVKGRRMTADEESRLTRDESREEKSPRRESRGSDFRYSREGDSRGSSLDVSGGEAEEDDADRSSDESAAAGEK